MEQGEGGDVVGDAAQFMDGTAQLSILNSLLSSTTKAKFMVPSSMVAFTGYEDKLREENWMRMEQTTKAEWIPFREDLEPWPIQVGHVDGYVREQGVAGEYQNQQKKDGFPLFEKDKYKCYYREYFFSPDTKEDLLKHYIFMSRLEDEDVNNIGSVIVCCEAKPPPPIPLNKHSIKALIWTKKGQERITISLRALSEAGSVIKAVKEEAPYLQPIRFNRIKDSLNVKEKLLKYEKQNVQVNYKFGVLFSREHQSVEDQMYNNEHGSPAFEEFLDFLGTRVTLQGFQGYRGGLDVKANTTGTHSVYTQYKGSEIMFHVSTLLQYYPADPQQVERKRHLGNDVVLIIFREGENEPFSPKWIRSQFNHVFIIVTPVPHPKGKPGTWYKVAITCKDGVIPFQPRLPFPPYFRKGKKAQEWFLSKLINAERAAFHAPDFVMKFRNTRKIQLRNIVEECLPEKEGLLSRSMTGSKIKYIAKGAKAVIQKGEENRNDDDDSMSDTTTFMAKWTPTSEGAKLENVVVDVSPREIAFKDPYCNNCVVERYTYFQVKRWAVGPNIVGLDFGPYREKGMVKLSTDRSEEIGLLLNEYINVIKSQIDKKSPSTASRVGQEPRSPDASPITGGLSSSPSSVPLTSKLSSAHAEKTADKEMFSSPPGQAPRFPQVPLSPRSRSLSTSNPNPPSRPLRGDASAASALHSSAPTSPFTPSSPVSSPPFTPSASPPNNPPTLRRPTPPRPPLSTSLVVPSSNGLSASTSVATLSHSSSRQTFVQSSSSPTSSTLAQPQSGLPAVPRRPIPPVPQRKDTVTSSADPPPQTSECDENAPLRPPRPTRATKKPNIPDFLNQPTAAPRVSYRSRKGGSVIGSPYSGATIRVSRRGSRPDPSFAEQTSEDINSPSDLPFLDAELPPAPQRSRPIPPVPPRRRETLDHP